MKTQNLYILQLFFCQIAEYLSSPIKDVKADRRLLAAILGYRKEDVGFINEVIRVHNKYRRIHGCRDLSQCARLRQQAGMHAQELADQGAQEPLNDPKLRFGIGENIYISCGNEVSAEEAVNDWYNEVCNYFSNRKSYDEYKHFAQIVWKATYLIGVGRRTSTKSGQKCTYVVTRYRPGVEQGPAESINIPKGNFDSSICSGNSGGIEARLQPSVGITSQTGSKGTSESATNSGKSMQGRTAQENTGPSDSGRLAGSSNAGSPERGASNSAQSTGESMPAAGEPVSQSESSQPVGLPNGGQPAKYSTPTGSVGTETSEVGSIAGNSGVTGSNSIPNVTPTSIPGTGDRERATDPENSHISPLIEQHETGAEGSLEESGGQQVSPTRTPHCPPCPGAEIQSESFETSVGAESITESSNNARSTGEGEQSSTNSSPSQPAGSTNSGNPSEQNISPANPDKSAEQVNPVDKANPDKHGKPDEQANPAKPVVSSGSGKQCPPCSCPNKQGSERPGEPQGSQAIQPQTGEGSKSSSSQGSPGELGGNEISQGQPSGKEIPQGQPSEGNNAPGNEVKPSSEGRPGGNVASPESAGVSGETTASENRPANQGGREGSEGKPASQGVNEGNTGSSGTSGPNVNQPTRGNQPAETESPNSPSEATGVTSGGTEGSSGTTGAPSGGTGGLQGSPSGGSEGSQGVTGNENQSQNTGNPEGTETTQGEGSRTSPGESVGETGSNGTGGVQGGQAGATQGTGGQGGGESGSIPEGGAFIESLDAFQQSALEAHNKYRQFHNSPPLVQNREMSAEATEFAQKLAKSSITNAEHSLKSSRENQGENVYAGCTTNPSGADVTKEWYKELCNYNYNKNAEIDEKKPTGHFTQVVWKSSAEFGIGRAYSSDQNCVYIVARYKPAGNIIGSESADIARGKMDGEYCGREFMAINKPESGMKEGLSSEGQSNGASQVGSEQPSQNTNGGDQQESGNASEGRKQHSNTGNSATNPSETSNVNQGIQQNSENSNTGATESNQSETGESSQPDTNTGEANQSETTSNSGEGSRQETSTGGRNEQSQTNPSGERDGDKRIKTPLQKSVLENTNKRYRGLRTE